MTERAPRDPARIGRRAGRAVHGVLVIWVIGAGILSVVPQIFGEAHAEDEPIEGCEATIAALESELVDRAGDAPDDPIAARAWLDTWDGRYRALAVPCGHHPSHPPLARVRDALEEHLLGAHGAPDDLHQR